jgi:phospholipase C
MFRLKQKILLEYGCIILLFNISDQTVLGSSLITQAILLNSESISSRWSAEDISDETVNTHLWIVENALKIFSNSPSIPQININKLNNILNANKKELRQGIYDADHLNPFMDFYTFASHFYNPHSNNTYIPGYWSNAKIAGVKYFEQSIAYYNQGNISMSVYYLGISLHYFVDVSQPMHANNYTNLSWPQGFHSKYEKFVDTIKDQVDNSNLTMIRLSNDNSPKEWFIQNASLGYRYFDKIVNSSTESKFLEAMISQSSSDKWHDEVTIPTIDILKKSQQTTAGYLNLWINTTQNLM